jgi:hypothetical protein
MGAENITQGVGGKFVTAKDEFTRAANTTAYTAGDVVSNDPTTTVLLRFRRCARTPGGSGAIIKARFTTDNKADTGAYRLILYTRSTVTTPAVTVAGDNLGDKLIYADRDYIVGQLDFPAATSGADTSNSTGASALWTGGIGSSTVAGGVLPFKCYDPGAGADNSGADVDLYGKLVAIGTPTPASSQKYSVELTILQN